MSNDRYKIKASSSGSGIAKVYTDFPGMSISDTLFVFDLNIEIVDSLREFFKDPVNKMNVVNIFQLEHWKDKALFEEGLRALIKYGIFENQDLCDKTFVLATDEEIYELANTIWPTEAKKITKFKGRPWPTDAFVGKFIPMTGCGSISPSPEKLDMNNLISWFFEVGYSEEMTTVEYSFNPETPNIIPIPLEPGIPMPPIPAPPSSDGSGEGSISYLYSIIYYEWNEYTTFPVVENTAKPMGSMVAANSRPQNTVTVHSRKQERVEIVLNVSESGSGE